MYSLTRRIFIHSLRSTKPYLSRRYAMAAKQSQPIIDLRSDHMTISTEPDLKFHYAWLRDHCRCANCVHEVTKQKLADTRSYAADTRVIHACTDTSGEEISVQWNDGHASSYTLKDLQQSFDPDSLRVNRVERYYWKRQDFENLQLPKLDHEEFIHEASAVRKVMHSLLRYGVAIIKGAPNDEQTMLSTVERLGPTMLTHEGHSTMLGSGIQMNDISYSAASLPMHTDMPYLSNPPGILFLQAFIRRCIGGATVVVDGVKIAQDLHKYDPSLLNILTHGLRHFRHNPAGMNYSNFFPMISQDTTSGEITTLRYGNLYSGHLIAPMETMPLYYEALRLYEKMIHDPKYQVHLYLEEGEQVFLDNFRLIHGRSGYKGERLMGGVNLSMDNFKSKARQLGLA